MARTYRKTPVIKDNAGGRKFAKREANKRVRKYKGNIPDGKFYRKLYCSYDIYDYVSYYPYEEYRKRFNNKRLREFYGWETEEDCYQDWAKVYLYK